MRRAVCGAALALLTCASAPTEPTQPGLWGSDGCSSSPDLGKAIVCCHEHDTSYRTGGYRGLWTERERKVADIDMWRCLLVHETPTLVADYYFKVVRRFGDTAWERNHEAASH